MYLLFNINQFWFSRHHLPIFLLKVHPGLKKSPSSIFAVSLDALYVTLAYAETFKTKMATLFGRLRFEKAMALSQRFSYLKLNLSLKLSLKLNKLQYYQYPAPHTQ